MIRTVAAFAALVAIQACAPSPGPVKRKMVGLLEKFDRWDYDGNGELSASELKDAEQIGGIPSDEIIDFYDTDEDRRISLVEAQSGMARVDEARDVVEELRD